MMTIIIITHYYPTAIACNRTETNQTLVNRHRQLNKLMAISQDRIIETAR
jgi:hypothetical protein